MTAVATAKPRRETPAAVARLAVAKVRANYILDKQNMIKVLVIQITSQRSSSGSSSYGIIISEYLFI